MLKPFSCVEVCYLVGLWLQLFAGKGFFRTGAISLLYFQGKERNPSWEGRSKIVTVDNMILYI